MLEPNDRMMLHDILRPPNDHVLEVAVGTTYSLDLISLLSAPVAFALFDIDASEIARDTGSLEVLESVRRYADRITVFTMGGQIRVPSTYQSVLSYLEGSVIEVRRPAPSRVFHPKIWALRYRDKSSGDQHHRLVILSRNLTYDASWDISAVLDESDGDNKGSKCAAPASDFLRALPSTAATDLTPDRKRQVMDLAASIRSARFEIPPPFHRVSLKPLGPQFPELEIPPTCDRALVISPFLSVDTVSSWGRSTRHLTLVSRQDELDRLPESTVPADTFVLSPYVSPQEEEPNALSGLHAKVYVADSGKTSTWWLGSANATHAAFHGNAEFLLELQGSTSSVGVKRLLEARKGETALIALLEPYLRNEDATVEESDDRISREDEALMGIVDSGIVLTIGSERTEGGQATYPVTLTCHAELAPDLVAFMRPIALRGSDRALEFRGQPLTWERVSLTSVSPFVVVTIKGENTIERVVLATIEGDPPRRRDAILAQLIATQEGFLRYLLLLLSDGAMDTSLVSALTPQLEQNNKQREQRVFDLPLLESMLRGLSRNPSDLNRVRELLVNLRSTPEGRDLVPVAFDELWEPFSAALEILGSGKSS